MNNKNTFYKLIIVMFFLWSHNSFGQLSQIENDWLENYIKQFNVNSGFSGAVLIAKEGEEIFKQIEGWQNLDPEILNSQETKFSMASGGKMFTALAIAQLVENKKLNLDDKIINYLPDFPLKEYAATVSIKQLLSHTSGIDDYWDEEYELNWNKIKTIEDKLPYITQDLIRYSPGEYYLYSNTGYIILGLIIEKISNKSYKEYVHENIFNVAEMKNTGYFDYSDNEDLANYYEGTSNEWFKVDVKPNIGSSDGGSYSTIKDLLCFSIALSKNQIVNKNTFLEMIQNKSFRENSEKANYGYGFQTLDLKGDIRIGHGGKSYGTYFNFVKLLNSEYTLVLFSNSESGNPDVLFGKILNFLVADQKERKRIMTVYPMVDLQKKDFNVQLVDRQSKENGENIKILKETADTELEKSAYWKIINQIFRSIKADDFESFNHLSLKKDAVTRASNESLYEFMRLGVIAKRGEVRDLHPMSPPLVMPDSKSPVRSVTFHLQDGTPGVLSFALKEGNMVDDLSLFIHKKICELDNGISCPRSILKLD